MVFETFRASSLKGRVLNVVCVLFILLMLCSCCVSFGGELFSADITSPTQQTWHFYQDHIATDSGRIEYSDLDNSVGSNCNSGGKAFVVMQVFVFISVFVLCVLLLFRVIGFSHEILEPVQRQLAFEWYLTLIAVFFSLLAVSIFGGTCYHAAQTFADWSVTIKGFAFNIISFFALITNCILLFLIRRDPVCHLGSTIDSGLSDPLSSESYDYQAGYAAQRAYDASTKGEQSSPYQHI